VILNVKERATECNRPAMRTRLARLGQELVGKFSERF
jgi:hypothetical protein